MEEDCEDKSSLASLGNDELMKMKDNEAWPDRPWGEELPRSEERLCQARVSMEEHQKGLLSHRGSSGEQGCFLASVPRSQVPVLMTSMERIIASQLQGAEPGGKAPWIPVLWSNSPNEAGCTEEFWQSYFEIFLFIEIPLAWWQICSISHYSSFWALEYYWEEKTPLLTGSSVSVSLARLRLLFAPGHSFFIV